MLDVYQEVVESIQSGRRAALATVILSDGSVPRLAGAKMLIREDGSSVGTVGGGGAEEQARKTAPAVIRSGQAQILRFDMGGKGHDAKMVCGGQMDIFIEPIAPAEGLYLFGAGHISQHTAALAKTLGFRVTVVDPREEYNSPERFPQADILLNKPYEEAFKELDITPNDYVIVVTPGHVLDELCLEYAIGTPARYVGMIGSRNKSKDVFERLMTRGVAPQRLERVYAPIGLPIGAETPEEIAVSIMAEIIRVKRLGDSKGINQ
jgi:xanthine dehydrogenase accessory factor